MRTELPIPVTETDETTVRVHIWNLLGTPTSNWLDNSPHLTPQDFAYEQSVHLGLPY